MLKIITSLPKIVSSLDNSQSIGLMLAKDSITAGGRTAMAYSVNEDKQDAKIEARERAIEETTTGVLWLAGIPALRKAFSYAIMNPALKNTGFNSKTSMKLLPSIQNTAKKLGIFQTKQVLNIDKKIEKKIINLNIAKTLISTAIPLYLLMKVLPKWLHKSSHERNNKDKKTNTPTKLFTGKINLNKHQKKIFDNFTTKHSNISFSGIGSSLGKLLNPKMIAQGAQLNPVDNMLFLDGGISSSRIYNSESKNERAEVAFREGGIIFFFFGATNIIKNGLEKISNKLFGTPIEVDAKILGNNSFINAMKDSVKSHTNKINFVDILNTSKEITKDVKTSNILKNEENILNFIKSEIKNNSLKTKDTFKFKNTILQSAKDLKLIDIIKIEKKDKSFEYILNKNSFIDTTKIAQVNDDIQNLFKKAKEQTKPVKKFLSKAFKVKTGMVIANTVICSVAMAVVLPKLQYMLREHLTGSKEYKYRNKTEK